MSLPLQGPADSFWTLHLALAWQPSVEIVLKMAGLNLTITLIEWQDAKVLTPIFNRREGWEEQTW
jgi:hypothetical protein